MSTLRKKTIRRKAQSQEMPPLDWTVRGYGALGGIGDEMEMDWQLQVEKRDLDSTGSAKRRPGKKNKQKQKQRKFDDENDDGDDDSISWRQTSRQDPVDHHKSAAEDNPNLLPLGSGKGRLKILRGKHRGDDDDDERYHPENGASHFDDGGAEREHAGTHPDRVQLLQRDHEQIYHHHHQQEIQQDLAIRRLEAYHTIESSFAGDTHIAVQIHGSDLPLPPLSSAFQDQQPYPPTLTLSETWANFEHDSQDPNFPLSTHSPPPTTTTMRPGILLPRNAGIKLRGVSDEPALIDAPAPDKSKIVVASQYLFQHDLERAGLLEERDVQGRLGGIGVIEAGRRGLRMPMKTYGTACVFFMRYRYHVATKGAEEDAASRYDFRDAALASLWLASKAEETPKKSKEILCAFRNSTLPPEDHLTPDDDVFENQAKLMINLERYLLEIVAFDFRARNCGELLAGLLVDLGIGDKVSKVAMAVGMDIYRTLAVLKQTRQTLALSCLELAARFCLDEGDIQRVVDRGLYERMGTTREEIIETLLDLLDLYLNHHALTTAGPRFSINDFMRVSMNLRAEMRANSYPRYTYIQEHPSAITSPAHTDAKSTPTLHGTPRTPIHTNGTRAKTSTTSKNDIASDKILVHEHDIDLGKPVSPPPPHILQQTSPSAHDTSPTSPTTAVREEIPLDDPSQIKQVVRFVLDASRAREEDILKRPYHNIETVDVREEREIWIPRDGTSEKVEGEMRAASSAVVNGTGASKLRNGVGGSSSAPTADVEMRDVPAGPRGHAGGHAREREREREREGAYYERREERERRDDRDKRDERDRRDERRVDPRDVRRRTPPPSSSARGYAREERGAYDRRW